ncbi:hypothetical protein PT974_00826 [Cladobotryum mycophilum]|uniref:F-box domain-containing protein n=1 Tax=Cladobotryum mycophilum TaxID=491253 RepID=A0ABR0T2S8_9HYPO
MFLHQLPPETLIRIFYFIGSAFFRRDVRRLHVSRWWYQLARPVFLEDLVFSAKTLEKFVQSSETEGMVPSMRDHVRSVSIGFDGLDGWRLHPLRPGTPAATSAPALSLYLVDEWTNELNSILAAFANILGQFKKLESLRLEARKERHGPLAKLWRRDYLMAAPMASFLSVRDLTCLEIDAVGTHVLDRSEGSSGIHLCSDVNAMLPTLRRLRIRMKDICTQVISIPEDSPPLPLEDLIINLSLIEPASPDTTFHYPKWCNPLPGSSFRQFKADMESRARELVPALKNPRIVRIVSHTVPGRAIHSFDALTGRRMLLKSDEPWDADGEDLDGLTITEQDYF